VESGNQGGIALGLVGCAAAGFGWLVAGRVLVPLHRVTDTARRIAAAPAADRGLQERISLRGPDDEVKDLATAFNTMVERLIQYWGAFVKHGKPHVAGQPAWPVYTDTPGFQLSLRTGQSVAIDDATINAEHQCEFGDTMTGQTANFAP
jgi:HAMP domain-containing protein